MGGWEVCVCGEGGAAARASHLPSLHPCIHRAAAAAAAPPPPTHTPPTRLFKPSPRDRGIHLPRRHHPQQSLPLPAQRAAVGRGGRQSQRRVLGPPLAAGSVSKCNAAALAHHAAEARHADCSLGVVTRHHDLKVGGGWGVDKAGRWIRRVGGWWVGVGAGELAPLTCAPCPALPPCSPPTTHTPTRPALTRADAPTHPRPPRPLRCPLSHPPTHPSRSHPCECPRPAAALSRLPCRRGGG